MKVIDRIKNTINDNDFFVGIYKDHIYIVNYQNILDFNNERIKLCINENNFSIYGKGFKLVRKTNIEIDIQGYFSKMEFNNE